jgi:superfamily II DNA or RNA helicase
MQPLKLLSSSSSWSDLNKKLEEFTTSNQSKLAGDIFENVCKYFLQTAPQYQTKLKNVWLLKEVKEDLKRKLNLPSTDEGIDLIAETFDGKYWAIQSKYRSDPKDTLTVKGDLATFANLAFNNCKNISLGLVMTTADKPPLKTKLLKSVSFVTLESFLELDDNNFEGWNLIKAKAEHKTIIPKALSPKPHQVKAIKNTIEYFKTKERGKVIMPCGTGKSLTAFWVANELKAKSVLIAVPSLALLQQTLKVWTREYLIAGIKPDWLCVCSDQTVSDDQDNFVSNIYELGIDVTTDKNEIKKFLKSKGNTKVLFTTYQSGKVTALGAKGFTFDLGIMDEAHKTVGLGSKPMAHLIHQKNIKIKHRLFMTATERLFRGDKEEYLSMDDPKDYGDLIYQLSFKEAIEANPPIISDYKVITFGISEPEIEAVYNDNKFIQIQKEIDDIKAREFATALALRKAIKKLGIRNAISFHSSIRRANNFKAQQELISKVYPEYGNLKAFHVSGDMPTNQRSSQMREFAESKGLMTNARCLTEGVDLPAIDCVVFTDPKKSKVDIVQAAGRALRLSPGKKFGYILVPLIIPENENVTEAAKDTAFEEIVATIRALATQDTRIIEYLRAVSSGTIPKGGSPVDGITKINVLTKVNEEEFNKSIQLKVWDRVAFGNWRPYEEAKKYAQLLELKGIKEWFQHTKSENFPKDIPVAPNLTLTYKKEFKGFGDFLGTGVIAFKLRKYRSYDKAKKYAQSLKFKNKKEWSEHTKSENFPKDIPAYPDNTYKKEFKGYGDFLGTGIIAPQLRKYRSYKEAKKYVQSLNLKGYEDWLKYKKSKLLPNDIPSTPARTYIKDFEGFGIYLGTGNISNKFKKYRSYEEAKKYAIAQNLKSSKEWNKFTKLKNFPTDIPKRPIYYKEFEGYGKFLGTGIIAPMRRKFRPYIQAKKFVQSLKLKNYEEWKKYTRSKDFPSDLSTVPYKTYKKDFVSIGDFLGTGTIAKQKIKYRDFDKVKKFAQKLKIKTLDEWKIQSKNFPQDIPNAPWHVYRNKGWKGTRDFLNNAKKLLSYNEAKKFIRKFNIKSSNEWRRYFKKNTVPKFIPSSPDSFYKNKNQWKGWGDFLGTGRIINQFKRFQIKKP